LAGRESPGPRSECFTLERPTTTSAAATPDRIDSLRAPLREPLYELARRLEKIQGTRR